MNVLFMSSKLSKQLCLIFVFDDWVPKLKGTSEVLNFSLLLFKTTLFLLWRQ